tara:strand:- start:1895 stop:2176 length:282 start_codon:yes stop_codon:yes gene_type:complete
MTCKAPIHGAWTLTRICPWDGSQVIMGVFPEHKAALLRLEHVMDHPDDNEEYRIEYHVFKSEEQELESLQKCKVARENYQKSQELLEESKKED